MIDYHHMCSLAAGGSSVFAGHPVQLNSIRSSGCLGEPSFFVPNLAVDAWMMVLAWPRRPSVLGITSQKGGSGQEFGGWRL